MPINCQYCTLLPKTLKWTFS